MSIGPRPYVPRHRAPRRSGRRATRHTQQYLPLIAAIIQLIATVVRVVHDR